MEDKYMYANQNDDHQTYDNFADVDLEDDYLKHDGFEHDGFEHDGFEHNDFEHNDFEHNDFEHNDFEHNDFEHNDFEHNDFEHNDIENDDIKNDNFEHNGFEDNDIEDDDLDFSYRKKESKSSSSKKQRAFTDPHHTIEMIQTALPYLKSKSQKTMNIVLKAAEFTSSFQNFGHNDELSTCDLNDTDVDIESMLLDMQKICSNKEKEFIDMMINFINAQKLYTTYKTIANLSPNTGTGGMNDYAKILGLGGLGDDMLSGNPMDLLKNFLSQEQKSSFDTMSMLFNAMT